MKYFPFFLILISILMNNSCKNTNETETTKSIANTQQIIKNVIIDKKFDLINYKKECTVLNASISDSTLSITFTYKGCNDDDLDLIFTGAYLKSLPPQASLILNKKSIGKDCGKQVKKTLLFNISPIQFLGEKSLVIQLPNYEPNLIYNY
jgi:hypothetical protein